MSNDIKKLNPSKLEEAFNIEPDTTTIANFDIHTKLINYDAYDAKDTEIESSIQQILDKALTAYDILIAEMSSVNTDDVKYLTRLAEVAASTLNTALQATQQHQKLKEHKDKLKNSTVKGAHNLANDFVSTTADLIAKLGTLTSSPLTHIPTLPKISVDADEVGASPDINDT